jgi:sec-independent protein translocase protein TatA
MVISLPLAFFNIGPMELVVIGLIGILLFGRRLPEIGKSLGKTIVEFKKGLNNTSEEITKAVSEGDQREDTTVLKAGPTQRAPKQIASSTDEP